jgi:RNA polymerase sigma-70 factor (ECF subfamily)
MPPTPREQVQQLFLRHSGLLHGFIASLCGDLVLAEDILQEVFLVVTAKAEDFQPGSNFMAWVRVIARFKTMELLRTQRRARGTLSEATIDLLEAALPDADAWSRQREALHRCMQRLSPAQRRLAELAYHDGLSPAAIAERLARTANVIHVLLSRLRAALRSCVLERLGVEEW